MNNRVLAAIVGAVSTACLATTAHAAVIFQDSFESLQPNNWRVYQQAGDSMSWVNAGGAGIEIQNARHRGRSAADGNFFVELDSHDGNGGVSGEQSNSTMASLVNLVMGQQYEVSFAYKPRTNRNGDDNGIELLVGNLDGTTLTSTDVLISVARRASEQPGWEMITVVFTAMADHNAIAFRAFGRQNTLGGFIDMVTVSSVPLPAGAVLFLTGIAGLTAARRKGKNVMDAPNA